MVTTSGGRDQRGRRIADRHVQLDRVRLDRDRDDEHDEQNQHHVDQRGRVDVNHDIRVARSIAASDFHGHERVTPPAASRSAPAAP
jgi:hypothetical protein